MPKLRKPEKITFLAHLVHIMVINGCSLRLKGWRLRGCSLRLRGGGSGGGEG